MTAVILGKQRLGARLEKKRNNNECAPQQKVNM